MTADERVDSGVRFGRTVLLTAEGELFRQPVDVLMIAANARGVMGTGGVRLAGGADIEREAMAQAPLTLGTAIFTLPGLLGERGVQSIAHCVINDQLGGPVRAEIVRRTIPFALRAIEERRFHSLALPLLGSGSAPGQLAPALVATAIVEELVAHLRRVTSRIERITLVSRSAEDIRILDDVLRVARDHAWGLPR